MNPLKGIAVFCAVIALSACVSDDAPSRPKLAYTPSYANEGFKMARAPLREQNTQHAAMTVASLSMETMTPEQFGAMEPAAGQGFVHEDSYPQEPAASHRTALDKNDLPAGCSLGDRFDRTETIAYQWGQNRIGFTHDADGADVKGGFLRYKLKFQPHQTSKERCKYKSSWQGLVGSAYNELYLRESNTVWQDLKSLRADGESRLDTLFQQ